jgi:hypothetical protein
MRTSVPVTHRKCCLCKTVKEIANFKKKSERYYESRCTECFNEYVRGRYDYDRERDKQLRQNYGITLAEYNVLYEAQNGVCAACKMPETRRAGRRKKIEDAAPDITPMLHVDHDHVTGKIRGLLCLECNTALGSLHDNIERIKSLLSYAEEKIDE